MWLFIVKVIYDFKKRMQNKEYSTISVTAWRKFNVVNTEAILRKDNMTFNKLNATIYPRFRQVMLMGFCYGLTTTDPAGLPSRLMQLNAKYN